MLNSNRSTFHVLLWFSPTRKKVMRLKSVGFGPEEFLSEIEKFFGGSGETRTRDQRIKRVDLLNLSI